MKKQKLVTVKEMAEILNRCERTFRKYVREYNIPHIRLGRDMLFNAEEVENFLKALTLETLNAESNQDFVEKQTKNKRSLKELDKTKNKYADLLGLS